MLYKDREIKELYDIKHRHDYDEDYVNYEDNILNNSLSPYLFNNDIMNSFLGLLQPILALFFDQFNVIKNFKNYIVDKYYFKNKN